MYFDYRGHDRACAVKDQGLTNDLAEAVSEITVCLPKGSPHSSVRIVNDASYANRSGYMNSSIPCSGVWLKKIRREIK